MYKACLHAQMIIDVKFINDIWILQSYPTFLQTTIHLTVWNVIANHVWQRIVHWIVWFSTYVINLNCIFHIQEQAVGAIYIFV